MLTTFDRYLTGRLLHTFSLLFLAAYGLYVVIDLFMNIDDFQENAAKGLEAAGGSRHLILFSGIAEYYLFRAFEFFEMAGPILIVISVITVLGLLRKSSETFPLLAAGIPAFRLLRPLLFSAVVLNACLILNQEFVIPSLAVQLQKPRGSQTAEVQRVDPVYDYSNFLMHIAGDQVLVDSQTLIGASFSLPEAQLSTRSCVLKAEQARFITADGRTTKRSGWLLQNVQGQFDPAVLTETGRERIHAVRDGKDVFIESEVTFDQLYNRGKNLKLLSSWQLIRRIQNPSTGKVPLRSQSLALHSRITRPILCLLSITIALPLVVRRESHSLITNMAVCSAVLGVSYAVTQACTALGSSGMLEPDMAAWLPVILNGAASTWTASLVQT